MIFKLTSKSSSFLFREPVDPQQFPDYNEVIENPMDLQTIVKKLKNLEYSFANAVLEDLELIIKNCIQYNNEDEIILKKARRFEECVKTAWNNLMKELQRKNIDINIPFDNSL